MSDTMQITVTNCSHPSSAPISARIYSDFFGKFKGLMFQRTFTSADTIIFDQKTDSKIDSAIHMLFMNFQIAVIWVNSEMEVVDIRLAKPWSLAYFPMKPARYVIETTLNYLEEYHIGDRLEFNHA